MSGRTDHKHGDSALSSEVARSAAALECAEAGRSRTPHMALQSGASFRSRRLAVRAVSCEPVSAVISLLSGKIQGNFASFDQSVAFVTSFSQLLQNVSSEFPTQRNREVFPSNREIVRWIWETS